MLRPQFCDLGPEIESAHKKHGWLPADSISGPKSQNCVRNIFFYGSLFLLTEPKFHSRLTLSSNNSRSKPHTPNKFHIFGIVRTSAFRWTYPGFFFFEQISRNKRFMRKGVFLHFCMTAPRKFSKNLQSDNIEV